jgi:ketosteroid isomerase-like protein
LPYWTILLTGKAGYFWSLKNQFMQPVTRQISEQFSLGNFTFCYDHFADDVIWNIIGNRSLKGKQDVIAYCEQMSIEMASTTLANFNILGEADAIAIEGKCTFVDTENKPGEVSYCDIFLFSAGKIASINSYCI